MSSRMTDAVPPLSHELDWPAGLEPYRLIDEAGSQGEPYAHYAWMRKNAPILRVRHEGAEVWMVSRYEDVRAAMRKPKVFQSLVTDVAPLAFLTLLDEPDHTRLRKVVASAFTPKVISETEALIRRIATERLDSMIASGGGEVVEMLARPLTMSMISSIVAVPIDELERVSHWADQLFTYFARLVRNAPGTATDEKDAKEFLAYLNDTLRRLHRQRSDSVGGTLARAWLDEGTITEKEATELCAFVFVSGFETTARLIAGAFRELHYHPTLLTRLREEPDAARRFVEELIRMRSPVHRAVRRTTQDVEMGGYVIPAGTIVRLLIASANRDEAAWPNGEAFDIDREAPDNHFGFGHGIHSCLGAPLARLETLVVARLIAQRVEAVSFDEDRDIAYLKGNSMIVGPETLRVDLVAAARSGGCPMRSE